MRLLRYGITTDKWHIDNYHGRSAPFYAILSHTWGPEDEEVTYEDIQSSTSSGLVKKLGYEKLNFTRSKAAEDGLIYYWIDTCCIKKSDSTELQRSLNSMFYWYQQAARCYVWLADVSSHDYVSERLPWKTAFSKSKWFRRGWTLQELIAPKSLMFYSKEGRLLGDKESLADTLAAVTGVPTTALLGADLSRFSKQTRLSWADRRLTKVPEDAAYSLIGIFGVTLPMLYADGDYESRKRAALNELDMVVGREAARAGKVKDVVRIGGASWEDLKVLSKRQLGELDGVLDEYIERLLRKTDMPTNMSSAGRMDHRARSGQARYWAEATLQMILGKFGVDYDHTAHYIEGQFDSRTASKRARIQRLEGAWHTLGLTAVRTVIDLKIWMEKWKA